ncbi:MAG: DUF4339 domain-containing protein [Myxococcales bacterium]|nr:DUF4339 domain-containing protein [Myxococcales bacterium]
MNTKENRTENAFGWYILSPAGDAIGPMSIDELRTRVRRGETTVDVAATCRGTREWRPIAHIPELTLVTGLRRRLARAAGVPRVPRRTVIAVIVIAFAFGMAMGTFARTSEPPPRATPIETPRR